MCLSREQTNVSFHISQNCRTMKITCLILFLLICCSRQDKQQQGVLHCGPQNVTVNTANQTLELTWEDDRSCFAATDELDYELRVVEGNQQLHDDVVTVTTDRNGFSHVWKWTSPMALECFSSLWLRLRVSSKHITSSWTEKLIVTGNKNSKDPEVYPRDLRLLVGSKVTFCCVVPAGQTFRHMNVSGYNMSDFNVTQETQRVFSLSVVLNEPSQSSCTDVICQSTHKDNGACVFIGYGPTVKDFQCETDLESVVCHWNVSTNKYVMQPTTYKLNGRVCAHGSEGICRQPGGVSSGETTWTLVAQNAVGSMKLLDTADFSRRIHMSSATVSVEGVTHTKVTVRWGWSFNGYDQLDITCQVNVSYDGWCRTTEARGVGVTSTSVNDLIPHWTYKVMLRCAATQHFWKWSEWSKTTSFHTLGDVPDKLDVWMKLKEDKVLIMWKVLLPNQSHGDIFNYTVTWSNVTDKQQQQQHRVITNNNVTLSVGTTQQYVVTVTAQNLNGSSAPSIIITPPRGRYNINRANVSQIIGDGAHSFTLSWLPSRAANCGYIVDWSPTSDSLMVDWIKLPVHQTNVTVVSKNFRHGQRYSLSVYACTHEAPLLLETRDGYVSEEKIRDGLFKPLRWKQSASEVEVSWDPIPLTEQTAFITGYTLSWSDSDNNNNDNQSVGTGDPTAMSLTASNLMISSYLFTLKARTHLGECGFTSFSATLNSPTDQLIKTVIISVGAVFVFLSFVAILCFRNWSSIKDKVYPQIPQPMLTDTWLFSAGHHHVIQYNSEADVVEVPQLLRKPGAEVKGPVKNLVLSDSLTRYSKPPPKDEPPPIAVTSSLGGYLLNPTYDPMTLSQGHVIMSEHQTPGGVDGYHPQRRTETDSMTSHQEHEGHMACDFAYVALPESM